MLFWIIFLVEKENITSENFKTPLLRLVQFYKLVKIFKLLSCKF